LEKTLPSYETIQESIIDATDYVGNEITIKDYELLCAAYEDQGIIGWDNFTRGRISKKWKDYMRNILTPGKTLEGKLLAFGKKNS